MDDEYRHGISNEPRCISSFVFLIGACGWQDDMYLVHWSEIENLQRFSGVFTTSSVPSQLTFGPYNGPLNMALKTNDRKHFDYILEVNAGCH